MADLVRTTWILIRKDLLIEWRTRARVNALFFLAIATLLIFAFAAGVDIHVLRDQSAGYIWLAILLSSTLSLGESFRVEIENGALDGLRLAPANARAVFLGKAISNLVLLFGLGVVLFPLMIALYDITLPGAKAGGDLGAVAGDVGRFLGFLALGCSAIAAPGTVYSAIASNARARDVLLPLLLFPLLIPALVACVKGTALVLGGDVQGQLSSWFGLLGGFNLLYWGLGFALFPRVIED